MIRIEKYLRNLDIENQTFIIAEIIPYLIMKKHLYITPNLIFENY